jgi:hypothetical protein
VSPSADTVHPADSGVRTSCRFLYSASKRGASWLSGGLLKCSGGKSRVRGWCQAVKGVILGWRWKGAGGGTAFCSGKTWACGNQHIYNHVMPRSDAGEAKLSGTHTSKDGLGAGGLSDSPSPVRPLLGGTTLLMVVESESLEPAGPRALARLTEGAVGSSACHHSIRLDVTFPCAWVFRVRRSGVRISQSCKCPHVESTGQAGLPCCPFPS